MPLFEYHCTSCGATFEQLIRSMRTPEAVVCPACKSQETEKLLSGFAVAGGGATNSVTGTNCAPGGT